MSNLVCRVGPYHVMRASVETSCRGRVVARVQALAIDGPGLKQPIVLPPGVGEQTAKSLCMAIAIAYRRGQIAGRARWLSRTMDRVRQIGAPTPRKPRRRA